MFPSCLEYTGQTVRVTVRSVRDSEMRTSEGERASEDAIWGYWRWFDEEIQTAEPQEDVRAGGKRRRLVTIQSDER